MISVKKCAIPTNTLLQRYSTEGAYIDCYWTEVSARVSFAEFVFAFYTTPLFKLERFILTLLVTKPSTDIQARQLAEGACDTFAAWQIEARGENELLLCDFQGRTRSWLMIVPTNTANDPRTRLYFGSAVVPIRSTKTGKLSLGFGYQSLIGFHRIYSVLLLYSAELQILHHMRSSYEKKNQFYR